MTCKQCEFWKNPIQRDGEEVQGFCKRYPPVLDPVYTSQIENSYIAATYDPNCFAFPLMNEDDWCGEFSPAFRH